MLIDIGRGCKVLTAQDHNLNLSPPSRYKEVNHKPQERTQSVHSYDRIAVIHNYFCGSPKNPREVLHAAAWTFIIHKLSAKVWLGPAKSSARKIPPQKREDMTVSTRIEQRLPSTKRVPSAQRIAPPRSLWAFRLVLVVELVCGCDGLHVVVW